MNKTEFEKDLEIDIENLDVEACLQSELYFKYASLAKEARKKHDYYKFKLSIVESELSQKIRLKPANFGVVKVTDKSTNEAVIIHPQYQLACKKIIKARHESELLNEAQNTMEQRKRMLELLVQLHGREYFAGPLAPHSPKEFYKKVKERKGEKLHEGMVKRSRKKKRTKNHG